MLESTLCNAVENLIIKYQMSEYQQKKCREFFNAQKVNDFIYAGHLKSKISVDIKVAYQMLEYLKEEGFLSNLYEVYCFDCNKSKGIFLDSIVSFNPDMYCDFCQKKLTVEDNIIVLYKVIHL